MSKRAAIYARVSSEHQARGHRVSIESQIADCEALCQERGFVIVARYVDKEKYRVRGKLVNPSGQRKDRPAYRQMLKDARSGHFDVIVAWKEDRLYRGMYAAMPLSEMLDEMGNRLDVELVKETFDRKMLGIKAALGKIEIDNIRERMIMGRRARLERGEAPGGNQVRYGYKKVNKRLAIREEEAKVVRQIFEWYIAGANNLEIRARLKEMGVPARRAKLWPKSTLITILSSEFYATGKLPTTLDGETFHIPCPPIITEETWRKAQRVREHNTYPVRNIKEDYLCAGLVYCACGWKCQAKARRSIRQKQVTGRYVCQRRQMAPETRPPDCAHATGSRKVDDYVWNFVKEVCSNPNVLQDAIDRKLAELRDRQAGLEAEAERLEKKLDSLTMERQWVITQARKGRITEDDMDMQLAGLQLQEMGYRKDLEERQAAAAIRQQADALSEWAQQYLKEIGAGVEALDKKPGKLSKAERKALFDELDAGQFKNKYPDDRLAQLRWAILEERRRIVRTLIEKVVVAKVPGRRRKIRPALAFQIPVQSAGIEDRRARLHSSNSAYPNSGD